MSVQVRLAMTLFGGTAISRPRDKSMIHSLGRISDWVDLDGYMLRSTMLEVGRHIFLLNLYRVESGGTILRETTVCLLWPRFDSARQSVISSAKKIVNVSVAHPSETQLGRFELEFEVDAKIIVEFTDGCFFDVVRSIVERRQEAPS